MHSERATARNAFGRARVVALAAAGAVCGHAITYALLYPNVPLRRSVLQQTGHAYWHGAVAAAVVGALWFLVVHVRHHASAGASGTTAPNRYRAAASQLASLQLLIFLSIEATERVEVGRGLSGLLDHRLVLVGGGVQLVVAVALAAAAWLLARTANAVGRALALAAFQPRPPRSTWPATVEIFLASVVSLPRRGRAPPLSLS